MSMPVAIPDILTSTGSAKPWQPLSRYAVTHTPAWICCRPCKGLMDTNRCRVRHRASITTDSVLYFSDRHGARLKRSENRPRVALISHLLSRRVRLLSTMSWQMIRAWYARCMYVHTCVSQKKIYIILHEAEVYRSAVTLLLTCGPVESCQSSARTRYMDHRHGDVAYDRHFSDCYRDDMPSQRNWIPSFLYVLPNFVDVWRSL